MSTTADQALLRFRSGCNCAQAVFCSFAGRYGLSETEALRYTLPFGGGMRCGEVCGAVTGGLLTIGAAVKDPADADAKAHGYAQTRAFIDRFRAANGALTCSALLQCDYETKERRQRAEKPNPFKSTCEAAVASAAEILADMGYRGLDLL